MIVALASVMSVGCLGTGFDNESPNEPENGAPQKSRTSPRSRAGPAQQPYEAGAGGANATGPGGLSGPGPPPAALPPQPQPYAPAPIGQVTNPNDPINIVDQNWMRSRAGGVLVELINALPPGQRERVKDVPFNADPSVGDVNAFAACENGAPLMAITDGLLQIEAYSAQLRATDELFGTRKLDQYLSYVAQNQKPNEPIVQPPPGLIDGGQHVDPRKVARQHVLFDEQLAFVLGHELAHHYLGHTGCANGPRTAGMNPLSLGVRVVSRPARAGLQPVQEAAADVAGTNNLLTAGQRRQGAHWNEEGAPC